MNEQVYPLLENFQVLRRDALASIRDRAFDTLLLYCDNYGDGIMSGCHLTTNRDVISLSPGIVRYGKFVYFVREPMSINYTPTDEYRMLKLHFSMQEDIESMRLRKINLVITPNMETKSDEMELCRFKLKRGAVLRTKYTDFFDRITEFDTINEIYCPYAAVGGSTLSPDVLFHFAKEASAYRLENLDQMFCLAALSGTLIPREGILFYLRQRLGGGNDLAEDNMSLYQGLCTVLREIQNGEELNSGPIRRNKREVFMD